jgi:hypothetical protein
MITFFNIHGAMVYVDEAGEVTGYEDVFTKIEMCRRHYAESGLGAATSTSSCARGSRRGGEGPLPCAIIRPRCGSRPPCDRHRPLLGSRSPPRLAESSTTPDTIEREGRMP